MRQLASPLLSSTSEWCVGVARARNACPSIFIANDLAQQASVAHTCACVIDDTQPAGRPAKRRPASLRRRLVGFAACARAHAHTAMRCVQILHAAIIITIIIIISAEPADVRRSLGRLASSLLLLLLLRRANKQKLCVCVFACDDNGIWLRQNAPLARAANATRCNSADHVNSARVVTRATRHAQMTRR